MMGKNLHEDGFDAEALRRSCVTIRSGDASVLGSGFLWLGNSQEPHGHSGIVVTNNHVVKDMFGDPVCVFEANQRLKAEILIVDDQLDLALLQLDSDAARAAGIDLEAGVESQPQRGLLSRSLGGANVREIHASEYTTFAEPVFSFGSPHYVDRVDRPQGEQYLRRIVTSGVVSGTHYGILEASELILTDAAIEHGMSGGPLIAGKDHAVIGVNVAGGMSLIGRTLPRSGLGEESGSAPVMGALGISSAVPAYWLDYAWSEWRRSGASRIVRGTVGLQERPRGEREPILYRSFLDSTVSEKRSGQATGAAVGSEPPEGSAAARAGIKIHDVILEFDGTMIDDPSRLAGALSADTIDRQCLTLLAREGEIVELWVEPTAS